METAANVDRGLSPDDARRVARLRLGGAERVKEEVREIRGIRLLEELGQDVRYGARTLRKAPGFAAVAILTLALGIGATTAIFSVVYGVVIRPLPYTDADRLVVFQGTHPEFGANPFASSMLDFVDWEEQATSFEAMSQFVRWTFNLTRRDVPERLLGGRVSGSFFPLLGTPALFGRTLGPEDDRPGNEFVVVLGYGLWQRVFAADAAIVGQAVTLNGRPHTIVGVMPAAFRFPEEDIEIWAPLGDQLGTSERGSRFLLSAARLRGGVSLGEGQREMDVISERLAQDFPDTNTDWGVRVVSAHETLVGEIRPALLALLGAVGVMLMIACANVGSLLLARASAREREFAIRAAIGAGRGRLLRQFVAESLLLSVLGGSLGIVWAYWSIRVLTTRLIATMPRLDEVDIDFTVCVFTVAVSLATTMVFGVLSAVQASRASLNQSLVEGGRTPSAAGGGLRGALVVAQVALAVVLLISGGLLLRSFSSLLAVNPGFDPRNVLHLSVFLGPPAYRTVPSQKTYVAEALRRVQRLPGIATVGSVTQLPIVDGHASLSFQIEGRPVPAADAPSASYSAVSAQYFETMGIPVVRGRGIERRDTEDSQLVAVVNENMASRFWANDDPVGKRFRWARESDDQGWLTIVGVVGDIKSGGLDKNEPPTVYAPYRQRAFSWLRWTSLVIRTESEPRSQIASVRGQLLEIDPNQPVNSIGTLEQTVDSSVAQRRLNTMLISLFAAAAALLAAIGIYGIVSYYVVRRTREIGLRRALGATHRDVIRLVVRQGLALTVAGVVLGLAGALAVTRSLESLLFGVTPTDIATFVTVPLLLVLVALLASCVPARRATHVDPLIALRTE